VARPAEASAATLDDGDATPKRLTFGLLAAVWFGLFALFFMAQAIWANGANMPRLQLLFILPELLGANFEPSPGASWANLSQRFDLLAVTALILAAAWGLGRFCLSRFVSPNQVMRAEATAFAGGIGLSLWSLATLGLGAARAPVPWLFILLSVAGLAAGIVPLIRRTRLPSVHDRGPAKGAPPSWLGWGVTIVCVPFVLAMLLGALLPTTDFDVKEYHLEGPKEYWQAGRVELLPHNVYTSFPFLTEMLSLSAMVIRGDWLRGAWAGQAVLMSFALIAAFGVFALTRRLAGDRAAWLAVLVWMTIPWTYRISVIAYTEGALACYLILTTLAFTRLVQSPHHTPCDANGGPALRIEPAQATPPLRGGGRHTECACYKGVGLTGLLAGSAAACKYPGVLSVVIPIGLAVVWMAWRNGTRGPRWRGVIVDAGIYSLGVLIAFGPWLLKNLIETGNPVYPLLWSLFGGESFDAATNERWKAAHAAPTYLWSQPSLILADLRHQLWEIFLRSDWQSPLIGGLVPLSLLAWRTVRGVRCLWLYALWLLLTWCWLTHRIDRFWVPMLPLLSVLAGIGLSEFWSLLAQVAVNASHPLAVVGATAARWSVAALVSLCVLFNLAFVTTPYAGFNGFLLDEAKAQEMVLGTSIHLCRQAGVRDGGKVLFVGEAAVFEADFPYVYNTVFDDSFFEQWFAAPVAGQPKSAWPLRPTDDIRHTLAEQGITHVCVHWLEVIRYRLPGSYGFTEFVHPSRFDALVEADLLERTPAEWRPEWKGLSQAEQAEVERWAPELRRGDNVRAVEVYRVRP
jgi:hypothetical protein